MADFRNGFPAWNFSPGDAILPSDDFIVSRFSSLSGCLNPKLRRFAPGLYPLYRGLFIPAACCEPALKQVAALFDAVTRDAGEKQHLVSRQLCPYTLQGLVLLGARKLVRLGEQHEPASLVAEPGDEVAVGRHQWMACVDEHHHADQALARAHVRVDELAPPLAQRLRHAGITVA